MNLPGYRAGEILYRAQPVEQGNGHVARTDAGIRLLRRPSHDPSYSNAGLVDPASHPGWLPPLTLVVRARFSHPIDQLHGTAGFGFWNAALGPTIRGLRPPRVIWFLAASPPYDVPLAMGVPGNGLKAAVLDAGRAGFFALLPAAPLGFLLMRSSTLYRSLWPLAQRALGAEEASLDRLDPTEFHTYTLEWERRSVSFSVDGTVVLTTSSVPAGPLQLVAWLDNAYAIATPRGRFGMGTVADTSERWLDLAELRILTPANRASRGGPAAP
jgi:hypothetical protein